MYWPHRSALKSSRPMVWLGQTALLWQPSLTVFIITDVFRTVVSRAYPKGDFHAISRFFCILPLPLPLCGVWWWPGALCGNHCNPISAFLCSWRIPPTAISHHRHSVPYWVVTRTQPQMFSSMQQTTREQLYLLLTEGGKGCLASTRISYLVPKLRITDNQPTYLRQLRV